MDADKLKTLLLRATLRSWMSFTGKSEEGLYAFTLYTCSEGLYIFASCNTSTALNRAARKLGIDEERIKWSPCDWEYHNLYEQEYSGVDEFLNTGWDDDYCNFKYNPAEIVDCCHHVLKRLVQSAEFKSFPNHKNVFVGILMGDQSAEDIKKFSVQIPKNCDIVA